MGKKPYKLRPFIVAVLLLFSLLKAVAQSDTSGIEISKQKIILEGTIYYVHTVEEGQTLYSIARAYNVDMIDIIKENPSSEYQLYVGQPLKIPVPDVTRQMPDELLDEDFYYHKVKPKQTAYFIANKYNVELDLLYAYNPGADTLIKVGDVIKIPKNRENFTKREFIEEDFQYYYYKVKRKDSFYSLSRLYKVSYDELIAVNEVLEDGLKAGQIIRIPKRNLVYAQKPTTDSLVAANYIVEPFEIFDETQCDSVKLANTVNEYKVALLLPFYSDYIYKMHQVIDTIKDTEDKRKLRFKSASFIEFYHGVLLALDEVKQQGENINLFVFDTANDTTVVDSIINQLTEITPDLIIGPAFPSMVKRVSAFSKKNEICMVSPFSTHPDLVSNNPYLFQVVPSDSIQRFNFARFINGHTDDYQRFIIYDGDSVNLLEVNKLLDELYPDTAQIFWKIKDSLLYNSVYNDSSYFRTYVFTDTTSMFEHQLSETRENAIVVMSDNPAYINNVLGKMNTLRNKYIIKLFGLPEWRKNEGLDIEFIHKVGLGVYSPFYLDLNDSITRAFLRKYNYIYKYTPERITLKGYSFGALGYDVASVFINALCTYGKGFHCCIKHSHDKKILSDYEFDKQPGEKGFINSSVYYIQYNYDFTISSLHLNSYVK